MDLIHHITNQNFNYMHTICKLGDNLQAIMIFRKGKILLPAGFWWTYSKFIFSINLKLSGLNHRKHMRTQKNNFVKQNSRCAFVCCDLKSWNTIRYSTLLYIYVLWYSFNKPLALERLHVWLKLQIQMSLCVNKCICQYSVYTYVCAYMYIYLCIYTYTYILIYANRFESNPSIYVLPQLVHMSTIYVVTFYS